MIQKTLNFIENDNVILESRKFDTDSCMNIDDNMSKIELNI